MRLLQARRDSDDYKLGIQTVSQSQLGCCMVSLVLPQRLCCLETRRHEQSDDIATKSAWRGDHEPVLSLLLCACVRAAELGVKVHNRSTHLGWYCCR